MAVFLDEEAENFEEQFSTFLAKKHQESANIDNLVRSIIHDVRIRGDIALAEYSFKFDSADFSKLPMRVTKEEIYQAMDSVDFKVLEALKLAAQRIENYHVNQIPKDDLYQDEIGVKLGCFWRAIESVGIYVPGGVATYPSSVLMNVIPAKIAGVKRIVMVVPAACGIINSSVLAAAHITGINEIYRIGGAQAIAALAYGTETIKPVVKITGPGNIYVAEAKRQVFGSVGIDMIAGPSEILIIADQDNNPNWIAADLLSQAEHDCNAQAIFITDNHSLAGAVKGSLEQQMSGLERRKIAAASWNNFGAVILIKDIRNAPYFVNRIAPEHLQIAVKEPNELLPYILNAGAVFIGRYTPQVIGDYIAGSNHILPTAGSARFSSGLNVLEFMKRIPIVELNSDHLNALGNVAMTLAREEGLEAHAHSISIRLNS